VLPRVAADDMGLELAVSGFEEREVDLHRDLTAEEGALLLFLAENALPTGLAVVDPPLLAGLVEVQTTGRVSSGRRDPRRPTAVDAALSRPAIDGWLAGVAEARGDGAWPVTGAAPPDLRAALLKLEEGAWTETRVDLDLGGGKRSGRLRLFRALEGDAHGGPERQEDLQAAVLPLETALEAVLCRVRVPLGTVATLEPGQLVPLPGVSLRRIRLEAPRGRPVATVHLGQSRGFRAVRILAEDHRDAGTGHRSGPMPPGPELSGLPTILPDLAGGGDLAAPGPLPLPDP
jgi:flagellar motor switch protein FliM